MKAYYKLVIIGDDEITTYLYNFLVNCIIKNEDFGKCLFISDKNFISLSVKKYFEPIKSITIKQNSKKANFIFFSTPPPPY